MAPVSIAAFIIARLRRERRNDRSFVQPRTRTKPPRRARSGARDCLPQQWKLYRSKGIKGERAKGDFVQWRETGFDGASNIMWTLANEACWNRAKEFACIFPFINARSIFGSGISREFVARRYFQNSRSSSSKRDRKGAMTFPNFRIYIYIYI